jgi:hypothetical protein
VRKYPARLDNHLPAHGLLLGVARDPDLEQVFRDFVAARSPALQRTAYLLVGDWGLAEDLV